MKQLALCLGLLLAAPAFAGELEGVKMPDQITVDGKALHLNGMGLRTKFFVAKVYVAGLYVETLSHDAAQLISSDQAKSVRLSMLRDLDKKQISEAIREGFEKNSKATLPQLQERLDKLISQIPDVKQGDELELTYLPGKGTLVKSKTGASTQIEGKDFADALFSVWLGKSPVDDDLKRGMLGEKK